VADRQAYPAWWRNWRLLNLQVCTVAIVRAEGDHDPVEVIDGLSLRGELVLERLGKGKRSRECDDSGIRYTARLILGDYFRAHRSGQRITDVQDPHSGRCALCGSNPGDQDENQSESIVHRTLLQAWEVLWRPQSDPRAVFSSPAGRGAYNARAACVEIRSIRSASVSHSLDGGRERARGVHRAGTDGRGHCPQHPEGRLWPRRLQSNGGEGHAARGRGGPAGELAAGGGGGGGRRGHVA